MRRIAVALALLAGMTARPAAALDTTDLLALAAMPLAVAAASELTGVPPAQLIDTVSLLNAADVPPVQFIEVVRYVPVALVAPPVPAEPDFVTFLRQQTGLGLRGPVLVTSIERRFRTYDIGDINLTVTAPRPVDAEFFPVVVRDRVVQSRTHPHGGPPGQLKKELGLKTGAEVVHGEKPGRSGEAKKPHINGAKPGNGGGHGQGQGHGKKGKGQAAVSPGSFQPGPAVYAMSGGSSGKGQGHGNPHAAGHGGGHGGGHGKGKG